MIDQHYTNIEEQIVGTNRLGVPGSACHLSDLTSFNLPMVHYNVVLNTLMIVYAFCV